MKYYLAGPMSGIPQCNFPAFYETASMLRARGYDIISPAELDDAETAAIALASEDGYPKTTHTWGEFLARDIKIVADQVQGIILMPGWNKSRGARLEAYVALLCKHQLKLYMPGSGRIVDIAEWQVRAWL